MTEEIAKRSETGIDSLGGVTSDSTIRNDTIWHFTGPDSLYEILKPDGGLYATHTAFLNDRHETHLVFDSLSLLQDQFETFPRVSDEKKRLLFEYARNGTIFCPFVTCFCREVKAPLMWRVYTRGGGFAIGFRKQLLVDNVICPKSFEFRSGSCHYGKFSTERLFKQSFTRQQTSTFLKTITTRPAAGIPLQTTFSETTPWYQEQFTITLLNLRIPHITIT